MIAVDTDMLLRILMDDTEQPKKVFVARRIAQHAKEVLVPQLVVTELVSILQTVHRLDKEAIIEALGLLLYNSAFIISYEKQMLEAIRLFKHHDIQFTQCLMIAESKSSGVALVTFDKTLSMVDGVSLACPASSVEPDI